MSLIGIDNAITWVQFRIRGGWKNLAFVGGIYLFVFGSLILLTVQTDVRNATSTFRNWSNVLLGLQLAALILFGGGRVTASIRGDLKTRVIESHRLMPMHPAQVMLGYIFGTTVHATLIFCMNLLLGIFTTVQSDRAPADWLLANGVVLLFGVFVWCVISLCAFLGQWATALMFILLTGGFSTGGLITVALPGVCVILGPLIGTTVFGMSMSSALTPQYAFSILAQLAMGAVLLLAASRRMARDDAPAFSPPLALLLLAAWTGASAVGILNWESFRPVMFRFMRLDMGMQFAATMAFTLILANLPIASAGRLRSVWQRRVDSGDQYAGRAPVHPLVALLLSILMCGLLQLVAPNISIHDRDRHILTASVLLTTLATLAMLQWGIYARREGSAGLVVSLYLFFLLVAPILADLVRHALTDRYEDTPIGTYSTYSPLGLFIELWTTERRPGELLPGLIANGVILLIALLFYLRHGLRRPRNGVPGAPTVI